MPRRTIPLVLGWEVLPRSISVRGAPEDDILVEPVPAVLVESDHGWVLIDTGFNPALVRDDALRRRFHGGAVTPVLPQGAGDPLQEACRGAGVELGDIVLVALSHLHNDHAGGLRHFARSGPRVAVQRAELDYGLQTPHPEPERNGIFRVDFDDPGIDWWLLDGDTELLPGICAVSTPGHTPGHQSFLVPDAGLAFAFDAADLRANIDQEIAPGALVGSTEEVALASLRRLKQLARDAGLELVPGHDPDAWAALALTLGFSGPLYPPAEGRK
jgi:glyoxylase-like metal-dependent hydrolase (beta-lactamase superfamily II)